jgi:hypothetical protein
VWKILLNQLLPELQPPPHSDPDLMKPLGVGRPRPRKKGCTEKCQNAPENIRFSVPEVGLTHVETEAQRRELA